MREIWLGGRPDRLCLLQVAKAWALREVSRELHDGQDHLPWVAGRFSRTMAQKTTIETHGWIFELAGMDGMSCMEGRHG